MNILLAEDDTNFGLVLKTEFEEDRYAVDLVSNGVEAILNFLTKTYGLVPPSASLRGGTCELSSELLIHPTATLRGEPGVRDRCPSGTAQLARSPRYKYAATQWERHSEDYQKNEYPYVSHHLMMAA